MVNNDSDMQLNAVLVSLKINAVLVSLKINAVLTISRRLDNGQLGSH
jgi:hypothetical protein